MSTREAAGSDRETGVDFAAAEFGTDAADPRSTFAFGERVHWRARFGAPAGSVRLHVVTVRADDGWERVVSGHELWLAHPGAAQYAGWLDQAAYRSPGRFILRFVRGGDVIAEGEFEVVGSPRASGTSDPVVH
jgi:hypothetical protein